MTAPEFHVACFSKEAQQLQQNHIDNRSRKHATDDAKQRLNRRSKYVHADSCATVHLTYNKNDIVDLSTKTEHCQIFIEWRATSTKRTLQR